MGKELFDNIPSKVADLLSDVKNGRFGLPDLQRPFVWKDNKVRELLDLILSILVDTLNSYKEDSYAAIGRAA